MPIESEEWIDLLDRFATKSDLDSFRDNVERTLSMISSKLDQFVVKEMHAIILQQEAEWKGELIKKLESMQKDIDILKQNRLPPWVPNLTHVIGWLLTIYVATHYGIRP